MSPNKRVLTLAAMPPEKSAYALARYSRSPDSIRESIAWVRAHDTGRFLESFYFQYGHASIADLGHAGLCFEGISEIAATEIEEEPLWDGQAKSSRYQDFSKQGFITPPEFSDADAATYREAGKQLLATYEAVRSAVFERLTQLLPRPEAMKPEVYQRNLAARAFDVARYLLFWGVPTNVGQVTSIRTLEKQIRRFRASEYQELRELGEEMAAACGELPDCRWDPEVPGEPLAPTLARHGEADIHSVTAKRQLRLWADQNLPKRPESASTKVDLVKALDLPADIAATLLYPVCNWAFRDLYELARGWSSGMRAEVIQTALGSRGKRDELLAGFRGGLYCYDLVIDVGAYRDLHRHRRCQKYRQDYSGELGFETPRLVGESGMTGVYEEAMRRALETMKRLPMPAGQYLLPFGARSRFLFKMDFAEAEYIAKLRSGVKGHFSYRQIAWEMKKAMEQVEPELAGYMEATPPWVEDPLVR